jgi:hypothetical protein
MCRPFAALRPPYTKHLNAKRLVIYDEPFVDRSTVALDRGFDHFFCVDFTQAF